MVGVAQLVRASGCGPEGRGFESHHSPHKKRPPKAVFFLSKPQAWYGVTPQRVWNRGSAAYGIDRQAASFVALRP